MSKLSDAEGVHTIELKFEAVGEPPRVTLSPIQTPILSPAFSPGFEEENIFTVSR